MAGHFPTGHERFLDDVKHLEVFSARQVVGFMLVLEMRQEFTGECAFDAFFIILGRWERAGPFELAHDFPQGGFDEGVFQGGAFLGLEPQVIVVDPAFDFEEDPGVAGVLHDVAGAHGE